jgi:predicted nucleic acid-binding protein
MKAVFVDTSALYALFSTSDTRHGEAVAILRDVHRRRSPLVTTDLVLVESYVLVHARGGLDALLEFRATLGRSAWLQTMTTSSEQQADAWELLKRRTDKGHSFIDAASFVVMRALGIQQAFSFDAHFSQEGFERVGSPSVRR